MTQPANAEYVRETSFEGEDGVKGGRSPAKRTLEGVRNANTLKPVRRQGLPRPRWRFHTKRHIATRSRWLKLFPLPQEGTTRVTG